MSSIVLTGDTSGTVTVSAPAVAGTRTITLPAATGTAILEDASNNLQMNSGFGSSATAYGCRAWVNFVGTGTVSINASGNVSSITDNGTGDYLVNFTTAMPDDDYATQATSKSTGSGTGYLAILKNATQTTSAVNILTIDVAGGTYNSGLVCVAVLR